MGVGGERARARPAWSPAFSFVRVSRAAWAIAEVVKIPLVALAFAAVACRNEGPRSARPDAALPIAVSSQTAAAQTVPPAATADPMADLSPGAIVRETREVTVDGATELWRLEWTSLPMPECMGNVFFTCPCAGFAFGDKGDLDLVRVRAGAAADRLHLGPLFEGHEARLRRWTPTAAEVTTGSAPAFATLTARAPATIMLLADYDHDGRATEFVLQVDAGPCGHTPSVVVGISKSNPSLHVFGTREKPREPLTLDRPEFWQRVERAPSVDLVQVGCGDHGSMQESSVRVTADGDLHARESLRPCAP